MYSLGYLSHRLPMSHVETSTVHKLAKIKILLYYLVYLCMKHIRVLISPPTHDSVETSTSLSSFWYRRYKSLQKLNFYSSFGVVLLGLSVWSTYLKVKSVKFATSCRPFILTTRVELHRFRIVTLLYGSTVKSLPSAISDFQIIFEANIYIYLRWGW